MDAYYQGFKIFLSSPSDVKKERDIAKKVIEDVGRVCREPLRIFTEVIRWEELAPVTPSEDTIQNMINDEVKKCHAFVLILGKRFGKIEAGFSKSNTEREIETVLELKKTNKKIKIFAYFKSLKPNEDPGEQESQVIALKSKLEDLGIFYRNYHNYEEFKDVFTHHMYETVIKFRGSSFKTNALGNFWLFGTPERYTDKRAAILYPQMTFSYLKPTDPSKYWLHKIVPQVLFEDMKAIAKVEKTLRFLGFSGFAKHSIDNPPSDINFMSRIWICQAKNRLGHDYQQKHKNKTKFKFTVTNNGLETKLFWRYSLNSDDYIEIRSPLHRYLKEQRMHMQINGEWKNEMGMVVAKDYAVLARIKNDNKSPTMREGHLYDYYIAGIRGLGTWGAAHFIDRNYEVFSNLDSTDDIQILLEIFYKNGRIIDISDVSNMPEHYFRSQFSLKTIRGEIAK